jgi:hypothetical protein
MVSAGRVLRSLVNFLITSLVLAILFCIHNVLQHIYYTNCRSNMFLVIFFKNSTFCRVLEDAISVIELNYARFLRI